jgi:hypothetical protein
MSEIIEKPDWKEFFQDFNTLHRGEKTRLGVFEVRDGVVNDLWIEDGLPFLDIDIDSKDGRETIGLVFERFRHSIKDVCTITRVSDEVVGGGLDILDNEGKTTALRFEDYVVVSED